MKTKIQIDIALKDLIPKFVKGLENDINTLETSLKKGDVEGLLQTSHRMRGDTPGFGFYEVGKMCGQIEDSARIGNLHSCQKYIDTLKEHFASLEIEFVKR